MTSQELAKSIEVKKLNKRSKLPLPEPPVIIPFGALVQDIEDDGSQARFTYLGELYQCSLDLLHSALGSGGTPAGSGTVSAARTEPAFRWQEIHTNSGELHRAKVPGGWFVMSDGPSRSIAFYPDPDHAWDGQTQD